MDVCIKNVEEETWRKIKIEASKRNLTLGKYLKVLVTSQKHTGASLLKHPPLLSEKGLREMKKMHEDLRSSFEERYAHRS